MAAERKRVVGVAGEADVEGSHFKTERCQPGGASSFPQPLDRLCIDVLRSDSPLQVGERIGYRSDSAVAEYRVCAVRSRPDGPDWWSAVLLERVAALGGAPAGARPEPCLDHGVDEGADAAIGDGGDLSLLLDFYSGCGAACDDAPPAVFPETDPITDAPGADPRPDAGSGDARHCE